LNTFLKPILKLLTLPFAVITLGLVWFFVSLLMLWLTDLIVPKFSIHGFWTYVWATIVVWVVNIVVDAILSPRRGRRSKAATQSA
jgi:putative membrane protein